MPIKEALLLGAVKSASEISESVSSLLSSNIIGLKPTGLAGMGNGEKVAEAQTTPSSPTNASLIFSNSMGGQVVLTLAGACPYMGRRDDQHYDIGGITSHMIANLVYFYELVTRRSYTAHYNLSKMLRKIEEKSRKGGIFSTSETHRILSDNDASDWFVIKFDANNSEYNYSREEQAQITRDVKYEIMDRAYARFAALYTGSPLPPPTPNFVESGASRAERELRRCLHWFCQASSAVIGVSNSIWGRNNAALNFHNNNNVWTTEQITGVQFVQRAGSLTFRNETR